MYIPHVNRNRKKKTRTLKTPIANAMTDLESLFDVSLAIEIAEYTARKATNTMNNEDSIQEFKTQFVQMVMKEFVNPVIAAYCEVLSSDDETT